YGEGPGSRNRTCSTWRGCRRVEGNSRRWEVAGKNHARRRIGAIVHKGKGERYLISSRPRIRARNRRCICRISKCAAGTDIGAECILETIFVILERRRRSRKREVSRLSFAGNIDVIAGVESNAGAGITLRAAKEGYVISGNAAARCGCDELSNE